MHLDNRTSVGHGMNAQAAWQCAGLRDQFSAAFYKYARYAHAENPRIHWHPNLSAVSPWTTRYFLLVPRCSPSSVLLW